MIYDIVVGYILVGSNSYYDPVVVDILTYFDVHLIDKGRQQFGMVTEIAIFTATPGKEEALGQGIIHGLEAIRQHPECISANGTRCVERNGRYMLSVVWTSLDAHMKDFRSGPLYLQWRSHIEGLFEDPPEVYHYQPY